MFQRFHIQTLSSLIFVLLALPSLAQDSLRLRHKLDSISQSFDSLKFSNLKHDSLQERLSKVDSIRSGVDSVKSCN
jgi:hypothetical protein